ncbi:MAG: extracellular solute-binding protein [Firmicutes bacterium]|nr:extracellular solute-binding protein [Bacillota bacterium]
MSKKVIAIAMVVILLVGGGLTAWLVTRTPRRDILRIGNWGHFLCPDLVSEFQAHHRQVTGNRNFRVRVQEFAANQSMYTALRYNRSDHDIMAPSDYMIERLISRNLLQPLDTSRLFFYNLDNYGNRIPVTGGEYGEYERFYWYESNFDNSVPSFFKDQVFAAAPTRTRMVEGETVIDRFAIPYFYGTMGVMYDPTRMVSVGGVSTFADTDAASAWIENNGWASIWEAQNNGIVSFIKQNARDTYGIAQLMLNRTALLNAADDEARMEIIRPLFADTSLQQITNAENLLLTLQGSTVIESNDNALTHFGSGVNTSGQLGLEWNVSAAWAMASNHNVRYHVPTEGTNLWVDSLVIPRRAGNVDAAYAFINFIMNQDNARRNADFVKGTSPIAEVAQNQFNEFSNFTHADFYREEIIFFDAPANNQDFIDWRTNFLYTMFPLESGSNALDRAGIKRYLDRHPGNTDFEREIVLMMTAVMLYIGS